MSKEEINAELKAVLDKPLLCPDGRQRQLKSFEWMDGQVSLYWGKGEFSEYAEADFAKEWNKYDEPVTETEPFILPTHREETHDPVHVAIPTPDLTESRLPTQVAPESQQIAIPVANQMPGLISDAKSIFDTGGIVSMMTEQMRKVAAGNPTAVNQANAMANLAKQIVEAGKLNLQMMRMAHDIKQAKS